MNNTEREKTLKNFSYLNGEPVIFTENGKNYLGSTDGYNLNKMMHVFELDEGDFRYFNSKGVKLFIDNNLPLHQSIIDDIIEKDYHEDAVLNMNFHAGVDDIKNIDQYSTVGSDWELPNYGKVPEPELDHNPLMHFEISTPERYIVKSYNKGQYLVEDRTGEFTCDFKFLQKLRHAGSVIDRTDRKYEYVKSAYEGRDYHNITHIENMLHVLNQYQFAFTEEEIIQLKAAILFHDFVYDVKDKMALNELLSAEAYMDYIKQNGWESFGYIHEVIRLIMVTKYHFSPLFSPKTNTEKFMMDIDLITFAFEYYEFRNVNEDITNEFINLGGYDKETVLSKRKAFLRSILTNKSLKFHTDFFKIYETTAYQNIERYLNELENK